MLHKYWAAPTLTVMALLGLGIGCGKGGDSKTSAITERSVNTEEQEKSASPGTQNCDAERELLSSVNTTAYENEAIITVILGGPQLPVVSGSPIPAEDESLVVPLGETVIKHLQEAGGSEIQTHITDPAALPPVAKRLYVYADRTTSIADIRTLTAKYEGVELRLLVRKPPTEVAAQYLKLFPDTPKNLAAKLPQLTDHETIDHEFARLTTSCEGFEEVLGLLRGGGGFDIVGTATSDALRKCDCGSEDVKEFMSLFHFTFSPKPHHNYIAVDMKKLKAAKKTTLESFISR